MLLIKTIFKTFWSITQQPLATLGLLGSWNLSAISSFSDNSFQDANIVYIVQKQYWYFWDCVQDMPPQKKNSTPIHSGELSLGLPLSFLVWFCHISKCVAGSWTSAIYYYICVSISMRLKNPIECWKRSCLLQTKFKADTLKTCFFLFLFLFLFLFFVFWWNLKRN